MAADKANKADKARRILAALEQLHRVEQWKMADLERGSPSWSKRRWS